MSKFSSIKLQYFFKYKFKLFIVLVSIVINANFSLFAQSQNKINTNRLELARPLVPTHSINNNLIDKSKSKFKSESAAADFADNPDNLDNSDNSDNSQKKMWNLDDVDLLALIGEMSRVTGRNFVIDPSVTGKASLISNEPMNDEQAYQAFLSILQVLGFSAVEAGAVTKIVPDSVAKQLDTKINSKDLRSLGDEMVVQVIPVQHVAATGLIQVLRSLVNPKGSIAAYGPSNILVVADHAANVARIVELVKKIDKQGADDVEIISLKDASSDELVKVLSNLMANNQQLGGELASGGLKMAADLRTNSILLSGDKSKRARLRTLIAQMDVPTPRTGDTEVIYLQYQNADALVPAIAGVIEAYHARQSNSSNDGNLSRSNSVSSGDPISAIAYKSNAINNSGLGNNDSGSNVGSTLQLPDARRTGGASAPGVHAEPNTNSLVVTAPPELMRSIKSVISRLDIRRLQVFVEALIVEVSMNDTQDLGIEWRLRNFKNDFAGGTNFSTNSLEPSAGLINVAAATAKATSERVLKNLPLSGVTVGFLRGGDLRAVLHALQQDTNTNIVSTPSLVAMDNETAEIVVADKIPFQTAAAVSTVTTGAPVVNSFDYRSIGLKLNITPMITKGDAIKLTLEQTTGNVKLPGSTPTTSERTIKTVVVVNNKDILVLGGLIETQRDATESKVPILGDIPLIGNLFKRNNETLKKKNLMVFIRPVVLRNNEESNNVSLSKYDYMRDDQLLYKVDPYSQIAKQMMPQLPDLDKKAGNKKLDLPDPYNSGSYIADLIG